MEKNSFKYDNFNKREKSFLILPITFSQVKKEINITIFLTKATQAGAI